MTSKHFFLRFDVWFLGITTLYWILALSGVGVENVLGEGYGHNYPFAAFLGLFVPLGPNNLILFLSPLMWPVLIAIVVIMVIGERKLREFNFPPLKKILAILVILFILTTATDIVTMFRLSSMNIFLNSLHSRSSTR